MKVVIGMVFAAAFAATSAFADGHASWTSVDSESSVAFGSIKNDSNGEVHHFEQVSGTVSETGELVVKIELLSVNTQIDIRNERMIELLFPEGQPEASLTGQVDMEALNALEVGATTLMDVEGTLSFGTVETTIDASMLVARLSDERLLVTTSDFIMLPTANIGIDAGVDQLMKLAGLSSITRVSPVSVRMVFTQ
ncbi:hypothetical protein [Granulosicoccus antarcticus]|uniref:Lipid/polyisoprenoid-binding YceI-like domain-containing protein n=1 Tax=Granulosicoccus antarcticus IMCC3135 TaxID=1192854 RepID=A0A2Z2NYH5_9GAMM|nr:hypothetical protein [Granulosicoccus antarcticus]ASJ76363.1 hypothetical protein IMCC3135_31580 [Granulosicoccus antarcticus IMCC3135]